MRLCAQQQTETSLTSNKTPSLTVQPVLVRTKWVKWIRMLFSMPATAYPRLSSGTPFHRIQVTRSNITGHGINQLPAVLLGSRRCDEPRTSFGHVFLVSFYVMFSMLDRIGLRRVYVRDVAQRIGPGTRRRRRKERSQAA